MSETVGYNVRALAKLVLVMALVGKERKRNKQPKNKTRFV